MSEKNLIRRKGLKCMKRMFSIVFLLAVFDFTFSATCLSQQDTTSQKPIKLILRDGSEFIGTVAGGDSVSMIFTTAGNVSITVQKNQVKAIEPLSGRFAEGQYVRSDPNDTRLFFAPTARPLNAGQGYVSAYEIFFPFVAVGVTNFFTLAGGVSLIPGLSDQVFYFAPKVTPVNVQNLTVSSGLLYINSTGGGSNPVGIIYGVTTFGNTDASLTAGLGWGFSGGETANKPIILLGGELRASNSIKLITENWFPPNSDFNFVSFGVRFFGENLSADLGLVHISSITSGFPFVPWLGFAYNFGTAD